jgi:hypothetical protein
LCCAAVNKQPLSLFFYLLFYLLCLPAFCQVIPQPLQKILPDIEIRYSVTFSFADENISGIEITAPSKRLTLDHALQYLSEKTGLAFNKISDRYISINPSKVNAFGVCGTLLSSDTNERIAGATIQSSNGIALSNERGFFQLKELTKDEIVQIRFVGYQPVSLSVSDFDRRDCKAIVMQPQFTSLEEVVVADFITKGIEKIVDGSFEIRGETLGILPGLTEPDVLQAIQALPGIESISESISDINVRGGTNDQNLILWDGIKMYQTGHFFGLISAFNPYITTKGTLIKNGTSSVFGEGISSTIQFTTDDHLAEKISGGAGFNMINSDAFIKLPISRKISLQLATRRSITDLLPTPTYKNYYDRAFKNTEVGNGLASDSVLESKEKFQFYDVSAKLLYDISGRDKVRISFLNISNDFEFQETQQLSNRLELKTSTLAQQSLAGSMIYHRIWSDRLKTSAQAYFSNYDLRAINEDITNRQRLDQENQVLETGMKLDAHYWLSKRIDLHGGYQFLELGILNFDEIINVRQSSVKEVLASQAAFIEGNIDLTDKTTIRLGVRANFFPEFKKTIFEPRFSFTQRMGKHFNLEVLGEMKSQANAQIIDFQNDFLGVEKRRWVLSNNSTIPIITSKQISSGVYFNKDDLLISIDGYYKLVDGIITSSQGFQGQFQNVRSIGSYETHGVDFLVKQRIKHISAWLTFSSASNSYTFSNLSPSVFPHNLDVRYMAGAGINYKTKRIEISLGVNGRTGKPFTQPIEGNEIVNSAINFGSPNSSRLPDYLRIDFSGWYFFKLGEKLRAQTGVSIWNMLDKQNTTNRIYSLSPDSRVQSLEQNALGITPNFLFRVNF